VHDKLRAALAGHYEIDREVGRGGMASVFLAHDVKHGRRVAIKVLHPELAAAVGPARFLREIETAAKLTHPHILSLHDSGERGGVLYYVMPFVEGESLRDRLTRERQLPLDDAVRIASDVADALGYAHEHGVVHRDIKPENILLSGRHAIVADFGIARAVQRASGDTLTATGVTLGTPQYMSPEQASAEHDVDGRSDIYALGCVLYEMLSGEPPFGGPTLQSVVAKHMTAEVPSLRTLRPTAPARLERVVTRMLAKSPADRYQDAASMLREFEGTKETAFDAAAERAPEHAILAGVTDASNASEPRRLRVPLWIPLVALVAAVGAFAIWHATNRADTRAPPQPLGASLRSLAVLPFDDVGGTVESSYFADGITEEIIDAIGRVPGLRVISRTSAFAFKEKRGLTIRQIADSLKVGAILEGSVRRDGNRLRVIARLIDVAADSQLIARDFNRELLDVFAVQNEIARDIAGTLRGHLTSVDSALAHASTTRDVQAYDLYLQGRALWNQRTPATLRTAVDLFEQAIARDSGFIAAYVGLSDAVILTGLIGDVEPREAGRRALTSADHALELDSLNGGAHAAKGHVLFEVYREKRRGEAHLRRALALDSSYNAARLYLGILRHDAGDFQDGIALLRDALDRDPLSPPLQAHLGRIFMSAGMMDSATAHLRIATELNPRWSLPHAWLGHALLTKRMTSEALNELRRAASLGSAVDSAILAHGLAVSGNRVEARAILTSLEQRPRMLNNLHAAMALAYAGLDERDQAFRWLDRHIDPGIGNITYLRLPGMSPLRTDPRFAEVRRKLGMDQ